MICKAKQENNGFCPHHNLQCGWPKCNEPPTPANVISSEQLSAMFQDLKGIDTSQSGYHWRVGWNAALRQAMDYSMPLYTTPPVAPVQEPVGYADQIAFDEAMRLGKGCDVWPVKGDYEQRTGRKLRPLYTTPPQRTWVGLTDEEIDKTPCELYAPDQGGMTVEEGLQLFARAIEAKLKEKNT